MHILALGLDEYLSADGDPIDLLKEIRARGAVSVACHPHEMSEFYANTFYLWNRRKTVAPLVDLWEVGCRWDLFPAVSRESLPHIANSGRASSGKRRIGEGGSSGSDRRPFFCPWNAN